MKYHFSHTSTVLDGVLNSLQILHKCLLVDLYPSYMDLNHRSVCNKDYPNSSMLLISKVKTKMVCSLRRGRQNEKELDKYVESILKYIYITKD